MSLVIDAGPLVTLLDPHSPDEPTISRLLTNDPGPLVLPAPISAEIDYLAHQIGGVRARRAFLDDLAAGRLEVVCLEFTEYDLIRRYNQQYADLDVGLADLSVVVLAHRFKTRRILTFDQRHFRALRPLEGGSFVLLPHDAA
jgi:uncharacterized protein